MLPQTRLGKRCPLGALVSCHTETGDTAVTMATSAGRQAVSRVDGPGGPKGGAKPSGVEEQSPVWSSSHPSSSSSSSRSVSSCIDVPRRRRSPEEVDMDELMAAMVLSRLSCSPLLHSPAPPHAAAPLTDGGGEFSDGGSSSGYWSVGRNGSPSPSPPITELAVNPATPPDEGLDMELEEVLLDEPARRRRRNSARAAYACLWPSCGKLLTSVVGIKRHIRTTHLCRGGEHERCSRSEEDFYYAEINQWEEEPQQSPPPSPPPPSPPAACGALSRSAPSSSGSIWQVQSEHCYQAPPPGHVTTAAASNAPPCRRMAPPTGCLKQGLTFRVRSVSVGEQWLQQQSAPCRRNRGEAKKCRKVYGIEHREQWCTACRWKKACQRFLD